MCGGGGGGGGRVGGGRIYVRVEVWGVCVVCVAWAITGQ